MYRQEIASQHFPVSVFGVLLTLILVLTACAQPAPVNTPAAAPTATATAQPTRPASTVVPITPTPAAVSPTVARTPTPVASAALPTSTAVSVLCQVLPVRAFGKVYSENPNVARALGCAAEPEKALVLAEQPFQNGFMYWRSDSRQILAVMLSGRWAVFPDTWNEGDPSPSVGTPVPSTPAGLTEPVRGFGKVWRERTEVRSALGWATANEQGYNGFVQPFTNGIMVWSDRRIVWVLFSDGTWLRFADST